ncbi:hypothetical protein FRC09_001265 [Ceratobasidium sp. 395]|nr:hypothetical protein FRC09_001265 [Ceratobasidium sp. 395]
MPPTRNARRSKASPFRQLDMIPNFDKKIQLFKVYGHEHDQLILPNGDLITRADWCVQWNSSFIDALLNRCFNGLSVEIKQGKDHTGTSFPGERWYAEVEEIKGEHEYSGNMELYVLINWFYSKTNLGNQNRVCTVGNLRELALSTHQQVIPADTILRKVVIRSFDENDRTQPTIAKDELWYRFTFRIGAKALANRLVTGNNHALPPGGCAVEACTKRYDPGADYQRLCPRPSCGIWYHDQCLRNLRFQKTGSLSLARRLEALLTGTKQFLCDKDADGIEVDDPIPTEFYRWLSDQYKKEFKGLAGCFPRYEVGSISNIVWLAQKPVIRGLNYGIVGNEEAITMARNALKSIWNGGQKNGWPSSKRVEWFSKCEDREEQHRLFKCMRCGLTI